MYSSRWVKWQDKKYSSNIALIEGRYYGIESWRAGKSGSFHRICHLVGAVDRIRYMVPDI